MRPIAYFLLFASLAPNIASTQRMTVKGNRFQVDGKEIWISGANTLEDMERVRQQIRRRLVEGTLPRIEEGRR